MILKLPLSNALWPHGGGFSRKNCFSLWVYAAGGTVVYLAIICVVDIYNEQLLF